MQRWRTKHDIRGICSYDGLPGGYMGPTTVGLNPFSSSSAGPGPLQANANVGLFQVPISASFLNPTSTTTFDPTVYANPNVTQGPLSNSLILGPQFGGGQSSSSSIFGGGGGRGGGGGNVVDNINYSPTTDLTQNLPPVPGFASMPNLLQGGVQATAFRPLPMIPAGSPMANMMPTTQPIAAGGISPTIASMMAMPEQQQIAGGQQIIPGTASQSGGYDQPQQPPQLPMGGANAMGIPMMSGGMGMPNIRPSAQPGNVMTAGGQQVPFNQVTASNPLQSEEAQMDVPLSAGTGRNLAPDQPISQSAQDTIDELERLKRQVSPAAAAAIDSYTKSIAAKLGEHKANKDVVEPKLKEAEAQRDAVVQKAHDEATDTGGASKLQKALDLLYKSKPPAQQASITRGANRFKYKGSAHPKLRTALAVAGFLGNTGIARGARAMETRMDAVEKAEEARDDKAYSEFLAEGYKLVGEEHASMATELTGTDAAVTDYRQQLSHNDAALRQGIENAGDMYMKPGQMKLEALGKEASIEEGQGAERKRGADEAQIPFKQAIEKGNLQAHQLSAASGAANAQLGRQKFNNELQKYAENEPGIRAEREAHTKYYEKLTGGSGPAIPPTVMQIMAGNQTPKTPTMSEDDVKKWAQKYGLKLTK